MTNQQLLGYISQQLQQGTSKEEIKKILSAQGWQEQDINKAIDSVESQRQPAPPGGTGTEMSQISITPTKARPLKKIILTTVIILGILLAGGGVFGYFYYYQAPERVIKRMADKISEVKSLEYSGRIVTKIKTDNPSVSSIMNGYAAGPEAENDSTPLEPASKEQTVTLEFSGASDVHDLNNPKASFQFNIDIEGLPDGFGMETRTIDKTTYFKFSGIPDLVFFDLSFLKDQWIKFDAQSIESIKEQFGLTEQEIEEAFKQEEEELSPEQIEQIREAIAEIKIFENTEKLPGEEIDGIKTHHYKYKIIKEGIVELVDKVNKIKSPDEPISEEELKDLREYLEMIESLEGEIWIGKKDSLPYKITFNANIKETEKTDSEGEINSSVQFKNYNQPVEINVPDQTKTIEEVLEEIFSAPSGMPPLTDTSIDTDGDGLSDDLEAALGTDPNNPDTDGDGYDDYKELEGGYDPLRAGE